MGRKQITGADLLSNLHSYSRDDRWYSESKATKAAKKVDTGGYPDSGVPYKESGEKGVVDYAMKKLKAHYGVEDQDNNEDIAQLAQSGLQKLEQYYGTRNQMSSVNTIQSGIQEGQNRYFNEDSELPTSGRIIQTMDDRAIEEALKIAKGRMQQSDEAYAEKFGRSPEATTEHSRQAAQIDRYQNELDSRNAEREQNTYYKKREDALNALTDEQRSNLEEYVNATREMNNTSKISGAMGGTSMITENLQNEAIDKKNAAKKALEDSGIKNLDVLAQYMGEIQDEENTIRINDSIKKDVDKHPVLAGTAYSALDVAMSPAAGLTAAVETLKRPYYADPSAPVNTNSDAYALTNFSNATESAVNDKINNKYGQFAYGVGMSTAKSAYSMAIGSEIVGGLGLTGNAAKTVGNIVTLPQFGTSAYATTLQQDQAKGISTENSIKHAAVAGINEMLFEVVSLDHAWDILHKSGKSAAKEAIVSTLAQAGIEGSEEGFTDIANAIADNIINGNQSEYNQNVQNYLSMGYTEQEARDLASKDFMGEIAQDVLAGAVSGGLMGGIANTANAVNYHKLGEHIETTTELKNNILDTVEKMDEDTGAKRILNEKGRDNLTADDFGAIVQSMAEESNADIEEVLTERFVELNETKQQARKDAKEIINAVSTASEDVTEEENTARVKKFEENLNLGTVYAETMRGEHTALNDALNNVQSSYHYTQMEKKGRDNHTGVTRAVVKGTGENQVVIDVQNVSGNHATVRMANGTLKDLSEIVIPDKNMQQLYNFATTMDTAKVANELINNYDNEEVGPYVHASAVFYNAGKLGTSSFEAMMNNPKNAQLVMSVNNPATLQMMYSIGQNNSQRGEVAPVQQTQEVHKGENFAKKEGKVVDLRTDKADSRMVSIAEKVAEKTGLEITLNDSLEHGENGHFSQALSRIALSSTSHNEYETLIHELNEWANTYNPEGMRKVMDAVLDYAQTKEGATYLSDRIQQYYDTYKRVESDKTYEGSADEFVFDYLAGVFSTEEGVKDFSNYMTEENISQKEQKSILETVADFFKELYDKIVSFLDDHVLSETAKKGLEADAEKAQEIRDMVMNVWQEAEENYQFNSATPENNEKFSLKTTVEETKDLIAVHNLSEEKLLKTLELGGFPIPSIAITKSSIGHNGYGEISVLFNRDTIDPENSENKVFGADAYTTRFPQIDYKVNKDELNNLAEKLGMSTSMLDSNAFNGKDVYRAAESLKQLPDVRNKFIKENNIKVEPVLRMPQAHPSFLTKDNIKNFIVGNNITLEQIVNDSRVREQFLEKVQETAGTGRIAAKWYQRIKDELEGMSDNEEIYNILAPAWNDNLDIIYGKAKPVEDAYSYSDGVNNAIKEHMDEFDLYALELAQPVIGEAGIYNGKDPYTKSGYLKSFEELHYDYNLENLVKAMKSKGVKNEEDSFVTDVNNVRAAASKEFKSIDDIKKAEERLQDLTPEEIEEKYGNARELFKNIVNTLSSIQNSSSGNSLIDNENAAHNIVDAVKGGLTENKVKKELQKYYKNVSDQTVQDVITLAKELRDIPVKYFEAKPQRAVSIDEVMAIAVPNNVSEDLMNQLNEKHIPTYIYEHDNTENRKEIVNNIAEEKNIKFSLNVDTNILKKAQKFKEENYKNFERVKVIDITERIKNDVKRLAGFDATGYEIYSNTDTYRHIEKRHGENGEHDHSMADLRDVALMGFVLKNYDNAELVLNNNGEIDTTSAFSSKDGSPAKMIKFSKKILDTMYVVLAVPENKYKKLWVISEYKQKNEDTSQSSHGNKTLPPTPKANTDTVSSNKIISQKTKKATKKYSIDIDDSVFDALYGEPSEHETEMSSIIQEGFESLKNVEVNERMMHKIAYAIKKENKSTYDIDKLTSNLTKVFAYLKEHQNADYNDMIRIVQEVAKPVIEESTDVDPYEQQAYKDVRDYVKGLDIRLNDEQKAEVAYYYGSYEKFRKMNFGNFNFTDKGTYLDNLWTEIADNSYQMLDYDVSSADQPMALVDMLNQLKPAKKNIFGMDKEQAAYDLALDIYRRFFVEQAQDAANKKVYEKTDRLIVRQQEYRKRVKAEYDESLAKLRTVETEKRKQQAARYEEKIADLKSAQQAALANADKKAAKKYQDDIVSWNRWLTRATQRADRTEQRMLELKAATRNNALAKRRNQEMSSMRERIKKNANGIISYFNTNTDKKHVPEALKDSVAKFITSIDFVSERANPDSNATMAWRESLNQMYRKLSDRNAAVEGNYEDIFNALMDQADGNKSTLLSDMSDFINANENVRITDMNANQLKQLDELITRLKRTITTVNQLYVNKRTDDARKLGADTIAELDQKKDKKLHANRTVQAVENLLDVNMMDARSYFYRLGDTAGSIYDALRTAFNDRVWLLKEAQTYMENALEGINTKDWTGDSAKVHTFMIRGKELQMTTAQIMSLYELRKRNQALLHMKVGGIRPKDITTAKKNVDISKSKLGKEIISRVKPVQLTEYDIDRVICSVLTPEQIKIADAMQQFMANNCADWGNKTTMMMNGYKRFGVKSYFPIKVDGNSVDTRDQTAYWATQNNSFTKQTRERAANALIVDDIFDVFTKHVTDMATYSTFTAPLSDAMKWFNHRNVEFDGVIAADTDSVQRQIELTYGKEYLEYFKKLIKDINAESVNGIESQIASTLVSKMKAASVGGNLRVAIQQPTAYIRAAAVMNPKYMAQAVFKKSAMKKAKENSAITQWKSWGYFETSIGQSMKSVITGQQSLKENIVEKSMILAQLGDDVTWGYLWNACEAEIKDKHPDVRYDSKEFIKLVADRFDEIVDQTQVVDSVLHRSQIMRSQDKLVQMATSFMAEPTKSYNLMVNAIRDVTEKKSKSSVKRFGRVLTAYTATQVINAAVVAVIDATRDLEDNDKTFWDKYIENLKGNMVDNMNPISMIPFAKDIVSIFQGYDISRLDMQGISKLYAGASNMAKYITDPEYREKHTFYDVSKETARGISLVTGIPGFNVLRDIESLYHTVTGKWLGGIIRSNTRQYQRSVDALLSGNNDEYDSIIQELSDKNVEEDKIESGIQNELKKRYTAGEMEQGTVENILKEQFNMDDNDIYYKLKKWENGSDWTKYSDLYSSMDNAYETGKISDRDKIKKEIEDLKKHGVKEENIKSQITEKYKPLYLEAKKNGNYADLKNLLISAYMMCGDSHADAMKKIDNWSKEKKN